jgi:hypothetical protein
VLFDGYTPIGVTAVFTLFRIPASLSMFWLKKMNVSSFLSYLENVCRYAGQAEYDCQSDGDDYTITVRHEFGLKWP